MATKDELKRIQEAKKQQKAILDTLLAQAKTDEERLKIKKGQIKLISSEGKTYKEHVELVKELNDQASELKRIQKEGIDSLMQQEQKLKGLTGIQSSIVGFEREKIKLLAQESSMHQNQKDAFGRISELNQELLGLSAEDIVSKGEIKRQIDEEISQLDEKAKRQGGLGEGSRRLLNLMKQEYAYADGISSLTENQQKILENQIKAYDTLKESIGTILDTFAVATSGVSGFFGTMLIGAGTLANKIGKVNSELGTTLFQTDGVGRKAGVLSFVFDDAAGTAKNLSSELGSTDRATFGLQANVGLMAMNMGISNGEAANLVGSFTRLNGNSTSVATDMVATSREFAKQNGIIPAQLMGDLAASAEEFAIFGKQGGKNIIEAAGYAAKLGVNMKSISGVADNLLDFESSITKELELGAMLGRNINLNKARELAFQGELEGAAKETLKAIGGQAAFERMNYYQRKQTADLLGVSVAELQKMVANEEQAANISGVVSKNFNQAGEFLNAGLNKYLGTSLTAMGGMVSSGAELGANFKMASEGASSLFGFLKGGSKTAETVTNTVDVVTDVSSVVDDASDVGDAAGAVKGAGIGMQLTSLSQGLRSMGDPKVLFGALNLIPTALGMVAILPGIPGMLALSVLGGPTGVGLRLLGNGLMTFGNTVSSALPAIGKALLVLLGFGIALLPTAYAMNLAAPAFEAFGNIITSVFAGVATVVTAVSNGLVSMLSVITLEKAAAMVVMGSGFGLMAIGIGSLAIAAALGGRTVTRFIGRIAESASLLGGGAAQGLQTTAQALMSMGSGISMINEQLDRLNPEKLEALSAFSMSLSIGGALTSVGNAVGGLVDSVSALIGGGEEGGSLSQYETDALKYLERIAVATEKGATIKGRDRSAFNPMGINNN